MALLSRIDGPVDPTRFVAAFDRVVARYTSLHSVIEHAEGTPQMVRSTRLPSTTLLQLDPDLVRDWAADRASRAIDVSTAAFDSVLLTHPDGHATWYLCIHHAFTDATSSAMVFHATAAEYHGHDSPVPPDTYREWVRGLTADESPRRAKALAYWASQTPTESLSGLYTAADSRTPRTHRVDIDIDAQLQVALDDQLTSAYRLVSPDLSWTTLLLSVAATLIYRLTGRTDVSLGIPVHNRSQPLARHAVGLVMDVVPVRLRVEPDDTVGLLWGRTTQAVFDSLANAVPGTASSQNVDGVVNVIARAEHGSFGPWPSTTEWIHSGAADPNHLLRFQLTAYGEQGRSLALDLNDRAARSDQRARAADHVLAILAAATRPDTRLDDIDLLSSDEHAVLNSWGSGSTAAPTPRPITADLEQALQARLDIALVDGTNTYTGSELWRWTEQVARWLAERGVGRGHRVAVCMPRSDQAVVAIMATLRAGAAYVMLDPDHPQARRQNIVERAGCGIVLETVPRLDEHTTIDTLPNHTSLDAALLNDEAYVLFTSGSSGEPKGVPITHRGLAGYLAFAA